MNADPDESNATAELSRLLEALVLGIATVEQQSRLNNLLAGDAALRQCASRFLEEEAFLRHHFQLIGRVGDWHLPPGDWAQSVAKPEVRKVQTTASPKRLSFVSCLAASLMALIVGGALWLLRPHAGADRLLTDGDSSPLLDLETAPLSAVPAGYRLLPQVTNVSWSGPVFARRPHNPLSTEMREGIVPYYAVDGRHAQGYMVRLPPGGVLSLVAAANAGAENSLSVIEFDGNAQPTGRRMSFSNRTFEPLAVTGDSRSSNLTLGPIGVLSEENLSGESRYYFLTSVHKLERFPDDAWHVSQMALMLRGDQFVHLGWDDSGTILEGETVEHVPDEDYDDLTATIRIYGNEEPALDDRQELRIVAAHSDYLRRMSLDNSDGHRELGIAGGGDQSSAEESDNEILAASKGAYHFAVAPGEILVVEVASRSQVPMIFAVVEEQTGRVRWKCEHLHPRVKNMGICAIENPTTRAQQFRMVCLHHPASTQSFDSWQAAIHKMLFEQQGFVNIGFEDGRAEASFDKVNVSLITMDTVDVHRRRPVDRAERRASGNNDTRPAKESR